MLTNRAYLGFIKHRGEWHNGNFEPIFLRHCLKQSKGAHFAQEAEKVQSCATVRVYWVCKVWRVRLCDYGSICHEPFWHTLHLLSLYQENGKCAQPYTQEKVLATQLQTLLQSVSLPFSEIEEMDKQITVWENESISEKGSVAQNLKEKIRANEEKLDVSFQFFLTAILNEKCIWSVKTCLCVKKWVCSNQKQILGNRERIGSNPCGVSFCP